MGEKEQQDAQTQREKWQRVRSRLRAELGEDVFTSWFGRVELESFNGTLVRVSVPTRFLKNWLQSHYYDRLLENARVEFAGAQKVDFRVRRPRGPAAGEGAPAVTALPESGEPIQVAEVAPAPPAAEPTAAEGFEGSPLDARFTFATFLVGPSNKLVHAAAQEVAEAVAARKALGYNPLYVHGDVGLGKTHVLHAIAWQVKSKRPAARVLYLTAERFMSSFVQAIRARDAVAFKERLRGIDILLIDDMEFLQGPTIQQEFCHTLNSLIDGGRQVVVAADRAPAQLDRLDARMRSRLAGGLLAEIGAMDHALRLKILKKRAADESRRDASFEIGDAVLDFLANRLTDSGRELEGAIIRLRAAHQLTEQPVTMEMAEYIIRELTRGSEPKRVKIDDILKVISKHYGVNRGDLLSSRRNRSIVRPRQIGMYLAKVLTSRSLPEIGRRFGNRDHTTVLHAIRKIDGLVKDDGGLREEIEMLKRMLRE